MREFRLGEFRLNQRSVRFVHSQIRMLCSWAGPICQIGPMDWIWYMEQARTTLLATVAKSLSTTGLVHDLNSNNKDDSQFLTPPLHSAQLCPRLRTNIQVGFLVHHFLGTTLARVQSCLIWTSWVPALSFLPHIYMYNYFTPLAYKLMCCPPYFSVSASHLPATACLPTCDEILFSFHNPNGSLLTEK